MRWPRLSRPAALLVCAFCAPPPAAPAEPPDPFEHAPPPALFGRDADPNPYDFRDPPDAVRPVPFWIWTGALTEEGVRGQLAAMKEAGIRAVVLQPSFGYDAATQTLDPDFRFSERYFALVGAALGAARESGMKVWLYNDSRWRGGAAAPRDAGEGQEGSPAASGHRPFARRLACVSHRVTGPGAARIDAPRGTPVYACAVRLTEGILAADTLVPLGERIKGGRLVWDAPAGAWEVFFLIEPEGEGDADDAATLPRSLDALSPKAVASFLAATLDEYARRFPDHLGATVPGLFTSAPPLGGFETHNPHTEVPWTDGLLEDFQKDRGYDLRPKLFLLWRDGEDAARVRVDFGSFIAARYAETYLKALHDGCAARRLLSIGQIPQGPFRARRSALGGDFLRAQRHLDAAGIQPFGVSLGDNAVKLVSSAAHLFGLPRALGGTFEMPGPLTPERLKAAADRHFVRGIALHLPGALYDSVESLSPAGIAPDLFLHTPWGRLYPRFQAYAGRMAYLLTGGLHAASAAVVFPTTSFMVEGALPEAGPVRKMEEPLAAISDVLFDGQFDFDYIDELALAGDPAFGATAGAADGVLSVGGESYRVVILPPATTISPAALDRLLQFAEGGGTLVAVGSLPARSAAGDDAALRARVQEVWGVDPVALPKEGAPVQRKVGKGICRFLPGPPGPALRSAVASAAPRDVTLDRPLPALKVLHRRRGTADVYFLANEDAAPVTVNASFPFAGPATLWDPMTGGVGFAPVQRSQEGSTTVTVSLPGFGSAALVFAPQDAGLAAVNDRTPRLRMAPPGFVTGFRQEAETLQAEVEATQAGEFRIEAMLRRRAYAKTFSIPEVPPPIPLDGPWSFQREVPGAPVEERAAGSWTDRYPDFSGRARYSRRINVSPEWLLQGIGIRLDLGDVRDTAEVYVGGRRIAELPWRPYTADLTPHLAAGENEIAVVVTHAPAGAAAAQKPPGGLLGPAKLVLTKRYRVVLTPVEER